MAKTYFRQSVDILSTTLSEEHPRTALAKGRLGGVLGQMGEDAEAESLLIESYTFLSERLGDENLNTREVIEAIVQFYETRDQADKATPYRSRLQASVD
jgi:hypothetical protein